MDSSIWWTPADFGKKTVLPSHFWRWQLCRTPWSPKMWGVKRISKPARPGQWWRQGGSSPLSRLQAGRLCPATPFCGATLALFCCIQCIVSSSAVISNSALFLHLTNFSMFKAILKASYLAISFKLLPAIIAFLYIIYLFRPSVIRQFK